MRTRLSTAALLVLAAGCSNSAPSPPPLGLAPAATAPLAADALLTRHPAFAPLVADAIDPDAEVAGRAMAMRFEPPAGRLRARFGAGADAAVRLWLEPDPASRWLTVTPRLGAPRPLERRDRLWVAASVDTATDLVWFARAAGIEELRVLRDARAPRHLRWSVDLGPAFASLRVRAGRIEVVDASGAVAVSSDPMFAIDAGGLRHPLSPTVARGETHWEIEVEIGSIEWTYPVVVDPAWISGGSMLTARVGHQLVKLASGQVLAIGGTNGVDVLSSVERFDPASRSWVADAPMSVPRQGHQAVRLPSGKVVVLAGQNALGAVATAEIYDPATGAWKSISGPNHPHLGGCATLLASGEVMLYGGGGTGYAEQYDPTSDRWSELADADGLSTCTLLPYASGDVLRAFGGQARIYQPASNVWLAPASLPAGLLIPSLGAVALAADGRALFSGGVCEGTGATCNAAALFDETTDVATGTMKSAREGHTLTLLANGLDLAIGGDSGTVALSTTELFDVTSGSWSYGPPLLAARTEHRAVLLDDGSVLVSGGTFAGVPLASAEVLVIGPAGATCTADSDCSSGFCVDGVCCSARCSGSCQACDVAGSIGTCALVTGAPHGARAACPGTGACQGTCDGTGPSCVVPDATTVCQPGSCAGGIAQPTLHCDGAGHCPLGVATRCAPFGCGAVGCKTTCLADADCADGYGCDLPAGTCSPRSPRGATCTGAGQCQRGLTCVDGYCCDKPCDGACEACNLSGSEGVCSAVPDGVADPRKLCVGTCALGCSGGSCAFKPASTACGGAASCGGNTLTPAASCTGTSADCPSPVPAACAGGLVCADGKSCKTSCASDADCVSGHCGAGGSCEGGVDAGVDAIAIDSKVIDPGATPSIAGAFTRCLTAKDCSTGFCVDGVCCDSACDQRCHSCALLSSPGHCTVEPAGMDLRGECGSIGTCYGTCGPSATCVGAGPGTMCARNRCTGPSTGVGAAYCTGNGEACTNDEVPFDCGAYACEPAFGACRTQCGSSADCAGGFYCDDAGRCQPESSAQKAGGCSVVAEGASGTAPQASSLLAISIALLARRRASERRRARFGSIVTRRRASPLLRSSKHD